MRPSALAVAAGLAGVTGLAHAAPSVVSLGQWTPLRSLPRGLCRWRGPVGHGVALTFDDGPSPRSTPLVLDRLDQLGVRATFFCLGRLAVAAPDLVDEIARRGHEIGVHGYEHESHLRHGPAWIRDDLRQAVAAVASGGSSVRWFRPPYGHTTTATMAAARAQGLEIVLWSAWGREWAAGGAARVAARVTRRLEPGAIVLLHDGDEFNPAGSAGCVVEALGPIVERIGERGLATAPLGELLAA
jgi:peptidoglycan/xylan/chitin deacetylase (PgdA/CDA1 family)